MAKQYPNGGYRNSTARGLSMPAQSSQPHSPWVPPKGGVGKPANDNKPRPVGSPANDNPDRPVPGNGGSRRVSVGNGSFVLDPKEWQHLNDARRALKAIRLAKRLGGAVAGKTIQSRIAWTILDIVTETLLENLWPQMQGTYSPAGWEHITYGVVGGTSFQGGIPNYGGVASTPYERITQGLYDPGIFNYKFSTLGYDPVPANTTLYQANIGSQVVPGTGTPGTTVAGLYQRENSLAVRFRHASTWHNPGGRWNFELQPNTFLSVRSRKLYRTEYREGSNREPISRMRPYPRPNGRPAVASQPKEPPLPKKGNDKKHHVRIGGIWAMTRGILNGVTEGLDLLESIWKALPKSVRNKYPKTPQGKAQAILNHSGQISWPDAIQNIIENQIEDKIFGSIGKKLGEAGRKRGNVFGYGTGPWDNGAPRLNIQFK